MRAELDGLVTVEDGQAVIRFERRLDASVERVWETLTRPERIVEWLGEGVVHLELEPGGEYRTRTTGPPELVDAVIAVAGEEALEQRNTVLTVEPPTLLEYTFGGDPASIVRWELRPDGDGCRLSLRHVVPSPEAARRNQVLPGWHLCLDRLEAAAGGRPGRWSRARFEALRDGYAGG
jgi:uncharacterized protein YndB with AHSA1/START domain